MYCEISLGVGQKEFTLSVEGWTKIYISSCPLRENSVSKENYFYLYKKNQILLATINVTIKSTLKHGSGYAQLEWTLALKC